MKPDTLRRKEEIICLLGENAPLKIMEVCGTHTVAISRAGLRKLFDGVIDFVSGPGCPVCVTPGDYVAKAIWLAQQGVVIATFGDMMKVPAGKYGTLADARADGGDIRVVYSPLDAVRIAQESSKKVVFLGVGFETTAPPIAGAIITADKLRLGNFSVLTAIKTIPVSLRFITSSNPINVGGLILPGHVSAIIGERPYQFLAKEFNIPSVIAGFEPEDILDSVYRLAKMVSQKSARVENSYSRVVTENGNIKAQELMSEVYQPCDSHWRGLGFLPRSGLEINEKFRSFDARFNFEIPECSVEDPPACKCASVILGIVKPFECPLFGDGCDPSNPQGPCMISSEGACSAYYKYGC